MALIVGAGPAELTAARKLCRIPGRRKVWLLEESGNRTVNDMALSMPTGFEAVHALFDETERHVVWGTKTE